MITWRLPSWKPFLPVSISSLSLALIFDKGFTCYVPDSQVVVTMQVDSTVFSAFAQSPLNFEPFSITAL